MLIKNGANVNAANNNGATPLFISAQKGNLLIQNVVRLFKINRFSFIGHEQVLHTLIQNGANVRAARNDSATPLLIAAQKGIL